MPSLVVDFAAPCGSVPQGLMALPCGLAAKACGSVAKGFVAKPLP